jgi:hypothetical protein
MTEDPYPRRAYPTTRHTTTPAYRPPTPAEQALTDLGPHASVTPLSGRPAFFSLVERAVFMVTCLFVVVTCIVVLESVRRAYVALAEIGAALEQVSKSWGEIGQGFGL